MRRRRLAREGFSSSKVQRRCGRSACPGSGGEGEEERLVDEKEQGCGESKAGRELPELQAGLRGDLAGQWVQRAGMQRVDMAGDHREDGSRGDQAGEDNTGVDTGGEQTAPNGGGVRQS